MFKEEKELWVKFACAALSGSAKTVGQRYLENADSEISEEDIVDDDCLFAAQYADKMVDLYYNKFKDC